MAGHLKVTLEHRTFHFAWCNRTEHDAICRSCRSIVVKEVCIHCERQKQQKAESLRKFLAKKAEEN